MSFRTGTSTVELFNILPDASGFNRSRNLLLRSLIRDDEIYVLLQQLITSYSLLNVFGLWVVMHCQEFQIDNRTEVLVAQSYFMKFNKRNANFQASGECALKVGRALRYQGMQCVEVLIAEHIQLFDARGHTESILQKFKIFQKHLIRQ